jgi:TonB family protein
MLAVAAAASHAAQDSAPKPAAGATRPSAAAPAAAIQGSPAQPPQRPLQIELKVKLTTLDQWDAEVDSNARLSWQVQESAQGRQDLGGHDLSYYWQLYVFTPATKETLEQLRDKAQKQSVAKDTVGLDRTLDEAAALLTAERGKALAVSFFLQAQSPVIYHQYQLGPWLARASEQDREGINNRVAATYDRLSKELAEVVKLGEPETAQVTAGRFFGLLVEPAAFFNSERSRLIKAQADLPTPVVVEPRTRGDKPCPPPVPPAKGRDKPTLGPDFPSSEDFYPPTVKFNDVEGTVTLRVSISATGCIERAEVVGTSGVAELDEGALNLAMAGSYIPMATGDKGAPGTLMFRVKFEQTDAFDASR